MAKEVRNVYLPTGFVAGLYNAIQNQAGKHTNFLPLHDCAFLLVLAEKYFYNSPEGKSMSYYPRFFTAPYWIGEEAIGELIFSKANYSSVVAKYTSRHRDFEQLGFSSQSIFDARERARKASTVAPLNYFGEEWHELTKGLNTEENKLLIPQSLYFKNAYSNAYYRLRMLNERYWRNTFYRMELQIVPNLTQAEAETILHSNVYTLKRDVPANGVEELSTELQKYMDSGRQRAFDNKYVEQDKFPVDAFVESLAKAMQDFSELGFDKSINGFEYEARVLEEDTTPKFKL